MRYGNPSRKTRFHASLKGHSVEFPGKGTVVKDKAPAGSFLADDGTLYVFVPPAIRAEVAAAGLLPESELQEAEEVKGPAKPEGEALKSALNDAFAILVAAGERNSFTAAGVPAVKAVEKLLGYDLTKSEVVDQWQIFMVDIKDKV